MFIKPMKECYIQTGHRVGVTITLGRKEEREVLLEVNLTSSKKK